MTNDGKPNSDSALSSSEGSALSPDKSAARVAELPQSVLSELKETVPGNREPAPPVK